MATILVIDDDIKLLASLSLQLEEAGYTVLKTSEISHAEILFAEEQPDLVLLEVKTNRDAGWDVLERLTPHAPVIVVSAAGREEDVVRGMEAGAVDYLAKPYRSVELLTRIRVRLGKAEAPNTDEPQPALPTDPPENLPPAPATRAEPESAAPPPQDVFAEQVAASMPENAVSSQQPASRGNPGSAAREESVFMTDTEELALLRSTSDESPALREEPSEVLPLGQRLHRERLRRRITLVQAESELHIRMWYLQAMEEERFALLPRGTLAADMLRAYAQYLGLDVDKALDEYHTLHYTPPVTPPSHLGSTRLPRVRLPRWAVFVVAVVLALTVSVAGISYFDPGGVSALGDNLRGFIADATATPTTPPTRVPSPTPTDAPTATPTLTPTFTPTPTNTTIPLPSPPITSTDALPPDTP